MDERKQFIMTLCESLAGVDAAPSEDQCAQMWCHFQLLRAANQHVNLTRITDPADAAVKHYADSIMAAVWAEQQHMAIATVLDIGTGGGFPAIPLAIVRPDWEITAIDGTAKKIKCVEQFIEQLGLDNCRTLHARAEHWHPDAPAFDLIIARAISSPATILKKARHLCASDGYVVCYTGGTLEPVEEAQFRRDSAKFSLEQLPPWNYELIEPGGTIKRNLTCFRKQHPD